MLEFLFDVVGEKFNTSREEGGASNDEEKVLSVTYFINKLFTTTETTEMSEVDQVLMNVKAAMIYKGLDFSIIFAEQAAQEERGRRTSSKEDKQKKGDSNAIDLTYHYSRFSQQLVAEEFCQRVQQLNAQGVTSE